MEIAHKEYSMGLLDQVIGAVSSGMGQRSGGQPDLLNAVIGMLGNDAPGGGLGGLMKQFQQGGLGDVMQSWVSTGKNLPISPEQLGQVLGGDSLGKLGQQLGMNNQDLLGQLSQMLPEVVDKLTPNGQLPQGGLGNVADLLGSLLGKR
jgi:uncharacterized protein YidB (DUF937 family)